MNTYTAVIERCPETGMYIGSVPGLHSAHTQARILDELQVNLQEVISLIREDGEPKLESEFLGILTVKVVS